MKFAEHLSAHITPEWRKQYINYEEMKTMLYMACEQAPSMENSSDDENLRKYFGKFDEEFLLYADKELKKINTFYAEKLAEATRKFATLKMELKDSLDNLKLGNKKDKKKMPTRKLQDLKLAFSEFYLSLILLQNYQTLNNTGFRKILKKHDKLISTDTGAKWRAEHVETSHFNTNKDIDNLINETENLVINELENGDRQKAMKRLRVPPLGETQSPWTTFKVGLFSGSFLVLLVAIGLSATFQEGGTENFKIAFSMYRGPLLIIIFLFLIGINIYGWRSSGVNHVLIFELNPRNHLSEQDLMELASIFGVVWALTLLSFVYSDPLKISAYVNPYVLVGIMFVFLINPIKMCRHEARFWFIRLCGRMFGAPFFHVGFADFWLADQLNSLVVALLDAQFLACFPFFTDSWKKATNTKVCLENSFIMRPLVNCIPAWIRFAQCLRRYYDSGEAFPHLVNAGKYASTFFVVIFATLKSYYKSDYTSVLDNPFYIMWILAQIVSSTYAYIWDIKMDWGLFDRNAGSENRFLREEIVYSNTMFYYFAIIEDFILRFTWTISIYLTEYNFVSSDMMTSITAPLEVIRRFIWNFFRLENEHLNNCGKFRAVRDISIAPIDSSDQTLILRMMDEPDGVVNRGKKNKMGKKRDVLLPDPAVSFRNVSVSSLPG